MPYKLVQVETRDRVATVRFDRGHVANALSVALMRELTQVAQELSEDPTLCAVVLTGRTDNFSMGMDLADPDVAVASQGSLAQRRQFFKAGPRMCRAWEEIDALTIVAIEGWCVGGGVALAVACDLRVIGASGHMQVPEIERGFNMSWGSVPRITNLVGPARAKRCIVLAERLDATRAAQWGLADEVVPGGGALDAALVMAQRAALLPPNGVRICKSAINAHANALNAGTSHADLDQFVLTMASQDCAQAVQAYQEKRPARYTGG